MRLLKRKPDSDDFEQITFRADDLPPYAILSHTWTEGQEVTYDELLASTGRGKAGFAKVVSMGTRSQPEGAISYERVSLSRTIHPPHLTYGEQPRFTRTYYQYWSLMQLPKSEYDTRLQAIPLRQLTHLVDMVDLE